MPVEDVFSISGRGTVVTGRIERGSIVKVGEEGNRWHQADRFQTTRNGVENVPQAADQGQADNVGVLLRGVA